jgi:hypothetical protein
LQIDTLELAIKSSNSRASMIIPCFKSRYGIECRTKKIKGDKKLIVEDVKNLMVELLPTEFTTSNKLGSVAEALATYYEKTLEVPL